MADHCATPPVDRLEADRLMPQAAVHQFHAGSAVGDAITNSMLLIRGILRAHGFHSQIFVQHRDPGLGDDMYELDALPRQAGYVLVLHHSMGFTAWNQIAALPARKILIYHNITPPEFLQSADMQCAAIVGRQQLADYRCHVVAALADSAFNVLELHAAGFTDPQICPLLFDTAALRQRAGGHRHTKAAAFTVLFVGRLVGAKAQDELIAAFAAFKRIYARPCRLVLPGAMHERDADYLRRIELATATAGLQDDVVLPGLVTDAELHGWYGRSDLYVSLSWHEGFGVPLVEAMAYGVPILAWPAGAVADTLSGAAELLADRATDAVAARMLTLATDPARRAAIMAAQDRVLHTFDLDRHTPVLMQAIGLARAAIPDQLAVQATVANVRSPPPDI